MKIKLDQKGAIQLVVLAILLAGIAVGVFLVTQGNPLKFFTRATTPPIVFKATDGSSLPENASGIPVSSSPTVRVELTSTLGPPSAASPSAYPTPVYNTPSSYSTFSYPTPTYASPSYGTPSSSDVQGVAYAAYVTPVGGSVSGPISSRKTISYKIAEDPGVGLNNALVQPYTAEPTVFQYTFTGSYHPCGSDQKFLWVEFKASDGSIDRRTAQIQIDGPCPTVSSPITPSPTAAPATPTPIPTPTTPISTLSLIHI